MELFYTKMQTPDPFLLTCFVIVCCILIFYIWKNMTSCFDITPVHVHHENSDFINHVLKNNKHLSKPYRPQKWISNGHIQTLLPCILSWLIKPDVQLEREYLIMDDGEQIAADWAVCDMEGQYLRDIAVILPGITGDIEGYGKLYKKCFKHNLRPVVISRRGYGGCKLKLPKLSAFGDASDLHCALKIIRERYPESKVTIIGVSAGAGLMVCYAGQFHDNCLADVYVGISAGYHTEKMFNKLEHSKVYAQFMLHNLKKRVVLPNIDLLCQADDIQRQNVLEAKSINQLEEQLNCKINGYKTLADYWKENDACHHWDKLKSPFLCIGSLDDPVCGKDFIPYEEFQKHPTTMLITTEKGGHCGFYESINSENWAYNVAIDFIETSFDYLDKKNN